MINYFNTNALKQIFVVVALLSLPACKSWGEKKTDKQENLRELTNILINKDQMLKAMEMMIEQLAQMGRVDQSQTKDILRDMSEKFDSQETRKAFMDIYDKHYNDQEIAELVKFYKSSVGRKTMEKMPEIMTEASHIGMKVAQDVMMKYMPKEEPVEPQSKIAPKPTGNGKKV